MTVPLAIITATGFVVGLGLIAFGAWQLHMDSLDYDDIASKHDGDPPSGLHVADSVFSIALGIVIFLAAITALVMGFK